MKLRCDEKGYRGKGGCHDALERTDRRGRQGSQPVGFETKQELSKDQITRTTIPESEIQAFEAVIRITAGLIRSSLSGRLDLGVSFPTDGRRISKSWREFDLADTGPYFGLRRVSASEFRWARSHRTESRISRRLGVSISWIIHICVYLVPIQIGVYPIDPFLDEFFSSVSTVPFVGVALYAVWAFWLLACVVKGTIKVGMRILFIPIHEMK
jgi:hypothetical protein